jgi:hypothetical protein
LNCGRDGCLVRDVKRHALRIEPATKLVERLGDIRMIGEGEPVPALREHFGDRRSDVARCAGDQNGPHSVKLSRLASAVSRRCTLWSSPSRKLSSGDPASSAGALATIRCATTKRMPAAQAYRSHALKVRVATTMRSSSPASGLASAIGRRGMEHLWNVMKKGLLAGDTLR